jgi:hypothetical protein
MPSSLSGGEDLLELQLWMTAVREREGTEKTTHGYLLARKPPAMNA